MKQIVALCLFVLPALNINAQALKVDSLINILETEKLSSVKQLALYEEISRLCYGYNLEMGIEYSIKGLQLAEKEKDKRMTSIFNRFLGTIYYHKASVDTSRIYLEKSLKTAIEAKDESLQTSVYGSLGNLYRLKHDYQQALDYYMKSLSFHDIPTNPAHAGSLNNIAIIHRIQNNPDRAIYYFNQALEVSRQLNLKQQEMEVDYGLGTVYADIKDLVRAEESFKRTLAISREIGNKPYEIISMNSLATCFSISKNFGKALEYAQDSLTVAEKFGDPRHILGAYGSLADIYREMGKFKACEDLAMKAWMMDSTSVEEASYTAYTLTIANIYMGQKERAEYFLNKYYDIMKSGNEKSLHNSLADMEIKHETEKKELRITSLEKERQLYVWLVIAGAMFTLSLGVALWLKIRNSQKEKQLAASNAVQEGEMSERERIAGELHDRLLGTLSAVKSDFDNTDISNKLNDCIEEVRRISRNLMPLPLRNGIKTALEDFTAQFPNVRFHFFGQEKRIEKRIEFVLYCCANELVSNSIRHSGAKNINVQLVQGENHIALTVQDDGSGFDEKTVIKGVGLKSIQDRVASCSGKINIFSSPNKGTETIIEINT